MLVLLLTEAHRYTLDGLFEWDPRLRECVLVLAYEELHEVEEVSCGTVVFTDLERLWGDELAAVSELAAELDGIQGARVLNDPRRTLRRLELLGLLHARGVNEFRAFRLGDVPDDLRLPAFLRLEVDHEGPRTPPLASREALDRQAARLLAQGKDPEHVLVVEFCDVSDDEGVFHKYAAWVVDGEVIPRHVLFSSRWWMKIPDLSDERTGRIEQEYYDLNPHEARLRQLAELACAEYGRIDYALKDGQIQVWELNTNPFVAPSVERYGPEQTPREKIFRSRLAAAVERMATSMPDVRVPLRVLPGTFARP